MEFGERVKEREKLTPSSRGGRTEGKRGRTNKNVGSRWELLK